MRYIPLLGGAAALALISASAHAQPAPATPDQPAPAPDTSTTTPPQDGPAAASIPDATETAQLSAQSTPDQPSRLYVMNTTNASGAQVQVVTNGPVPDTVDNRRLYRPLSRAGRRSKPEGD